MDLLLPLCNVIVLFSFFFRFSVSWRSLVGSCNCVFVFVWLVRLARFRRLVRPSWSAICNLHLGLLQCYETMMSRHSSLLTACEGERHHIADLQYYGTVRTGPRQTYPYPVSLSYSAMKDSLGSPFPKLVLVSFYHLAASAVHAVQCMQCSANFWPARRRGVSPWTYA